MKKTTITFLIVLVLALTACSGGSSRTRQFNSNQTTNAASTGLPLASKLVIGSFKLEKTDYPISKEQAVELLPLWQVYQKLSTSDTAAQEEISALADQIQETMTADQMKAINGMNLTQQDIFTTMQEQGVQSGNRQQTAQGNGNQSNNRNFQGPGGDFVVRPADGGGPGGGPGFGGGQGLNPEQLATMEARRAQNGGNSGFRSNGAPAPLIEALIKLLQGKAGS